MTKIIWALIGINTIGLLIFIGAYFVMNNGKHVDYQEKGWTFILAAVGLITILLAAIPLRFMHSTGSIIFAGIFAALPLAIASGIFINNRAERLKQQRSFAETYYKDKTQRSIAAAIETNDTTKLKELIKGQDLNIKGTRVWDEDGLNYLQFAIRLRSNTISFPFDEDANTAAIKILIANGAATTPALAEAAQYLSPEKFLLLLEAGADPNVRGLTEPDPLLFEVIGSDKRQNDIAIMLIKKGAAVNIKKGIYTLVMHVAYRAGTSEACHDAWRIVRVLLEDAHADYTYTSKEGISLNSIIKKISQEATEKNITMSPDFHEVVTWLQKRNISTTPLTK
ncbi:MAG: hypothetical protein ABIN94_01510 [Ferruginibacter sp.]